MNYFLKLDTSQVYIHEDSQLNYQKKSVIIAYTFLLTHEILFYTYTLSWVN